MPAGKCRVATEIASVGKNCLELRSGCCCTVVEDAADCGEQSRKPGVGILCKKEDGVSSEGGGAEKAVGPYHTEGPLFLCNSGWPSSVWG